MRAVGKLLTNRTFILVSALVGGLVLGSPAARLTPLMMPALIAVLAVSLSQLAVREFWPATRMLRPLLAVVLLNYVLLGSVMLALARWLAPSDELWVGYVLAAAGPPGVAIVPFTHVLRGDLQLSARGMFGGYLASLLLTPALVYLLAGNVTIPPALLFRTILPLVVMPFVLAQLIRPTPLAPLVDRWRGTIINWGFFLVIITAVGVNRDVFLRQPGVLLAVSAPAVVSTFGLAFLVERLGLRLRLPVETTRSAILLATVKNAPFAAAVGLTLYGEASSVPGAVLGAWYALYFVYLGIKSERAAA